MVSALVGVSRNKAAEIIGQALVSVNSESAVKTTVKVGSGDVISVRSKGKFIIYSLEEKTRKDRIILKYKKYV